MTQDVVLEHQNNRYFLNTQTLALRQRSLMSGAVLYAVFCLMDFVRFPSQLYSITIPVRLVFFLIPLTVLAIVFWRKKPEDQKNHMGWMVYLYIAAGFIHSFLLYNVTKLNISFPDSGFILILIYGCLLIGLPVKLAGTASAVILAGFVVSMSLSGYATSEILFNLVIYSSFAALCLAVNKVCVSILIQNFKLIKRLYYETAYDGMTQLHNRSYLDEQLNILLQIADRDDRGVGIVFLDVDHFKQFNDTYGHQKADKALIELSKVLKVVCRRESDFAARYGGDEFVLVFYDIDENTLRNKCERIVQRVREMNIPHKTNKVEQKLTVSVGAIITTPNIKISMNAALKQADKSLYSAKQKGRNGYHLAIAHSAEDSKK